MYLTHILVNLQKVTKLFTNKKMEKFDFGGISIPVENNYSDIRTARESRDNFIPQDLAKNLINCLSSFYRENKLLSPENRGKLNTLLISLAVTLLSSDMNNHAPEKEASIKTTPDTNHSFKLDTIPQSDTPMKKSLSLEYLSETKPTTNPHHFPKAENLPPTFASSQKNSPIIIKKSESKIAKELPRKESTKENASERVQNIVDEIQIIAAVLTKNEKLYPREMFTEELSIAQKIVESGLKLDAESEKNAVGQTQVKPITMKEDIRYANILSRAGDIQTNLPNEKDITEKDISEMITLVKSNAIYANAFKDIYLIDLLNNHGIGKKEFDRGDIDGALKKILAAYNWNPNDFKKYENQESVWPAQSQRYYENIFYYRDLVIKIKAQMGNMQIVTDFSVLSPILAMEINKYEKELDDKDPESKIITQKIIRGYLEVVSEMEKIKEKPLTIEEIQRLVDKFNNRIYKDYQNYLANKTDFENSAFEL